VKKGIACGILAFAVLTLAGCGLPMNTYESVYDRYYATTLGLSTSADVLALVQDKDKELLSQSESVVAACGTEGKNDRTHWFNMVAFDENSSVAVRKYGFVLEETAWGPNRQPRPGLRFDIESIVDASLLSEPYPNINAMKIAVLQSLRNQFGQDAQNVIFDNATLRNSTIMANQAIHGALNKLLQSPAEAARLGELEGMAFDHMMLGESRIRMLIVDNTVKLKIKSGKPWFSTPFEKHPDVINM
jgi:hypothetical protein